MARVIALELEIHGSHGIQAFRYDAALALIESGRLQPEKMIGSRITLEQSIDVLTAMDASTATGIPVHYRVLIAAPCREPALFEKSHVQKAMTDHKVLLCITSRNVS